MPAALSLRATSRGIAIGVRDDRRDHRLHRREPDRQRPAKCSIRMPMKRSIRAEDRAVQHHRAVLGAVLADVARVEPFGQHPVGLDRADLPGPADRVGQVEFELGRIERAFAGQFLPAVFARWPCPRRDRVAQFLLRPCPTSPRCRTAFRAQRQLDRIAEPESPCRPVEQLAEGRTSSTIWSSRQKMCASSCVNWRTRISRAARRAVRCGGSSRTRPCAAAGRDSS
jgi:hypothetical protein